MAHIFVYKKAVTIKLLEVNVLKYALLEEIKVSKDTEINNHKRE